MPHARLAAAALALVAAVQLSHADTAVPATKVDPVLAEVVAGAWRGEEAKARDRYRHPVESLTFWGLAPGMTILEIQPGSASWWTEILAPYAKRTGGAYYATGADLANPKLSEGARNARKRFEERYGAQPDIYGPIRVLDWGDVTRTLPAEKFDFILTARSIHGWMQDEPGTVEETFAAFYKALKPGGILAVEQHRANPLPEGAAEKPDSGYVTEAYVIAQAEKAGFRLAAKSEINANPKDTKDHPFGVWTLPPALRSTAYGSGQESDPDFDHSKYLSIGESDRMTLRFERPVRK
jgi:predicted methyltransferase